MPTRGTRHLLPVAATVLLIAGLLLLALFRILSGTEHHAYSSGPVPPAQSHVTAGALYNLSVPGGVGKLRSRGADVATGQCSWSTNGSATQALEVTAAGASTKATNVVATFIAPYTGEISVQCAGWGAMFIDDADGASSDKAGWCLVFGIAALTVGAGLGLSAWRSARESNVGSGNRSASEDDEVQRFVHAVSVRSDDGEVRASDGDDVLS